jgi:Icc-related predicted phosphoesterase
MPFRLFFTADLHGSDRCFRKLVNAAKFYGARALVIGGDLTGKVVVAFVDNGDGTYRCEFLNKKRIKVAQVPSLEGQLADAGMYTCRLSPSEYEDLQAQPRKASELFNRFMRDRLTAWIRLAEERLRPQGLRLHLILGNDDRFEVDAALEGSDTVVPFEGRAVEVDRYELVGCGYTNPTPWHTPRELPEDALRKRLQAAVDRARHMDRTIFVFHCPPRDTSLDLAPRLTPDLKVVQRAGTVEYVHVGSSSVRDLIREHQPFLSLHGHIHESRGEETLGKTLTMNPGSEYSEGILHGVLIDLEDGRIVNHQFTMG